MKKYKDKIIDFRISNGIAIFISILRGEKIALGPTDTILGLCAITSQQTFLRLNELKNRCEKPYLLLIKNIAIAYEYGDSAQLDSWKDLFDMYWPGKLTVIVKARSDLAPWLISKNQTVALRIPNNDLLQIVLNEIPVLFSTSANLAGQSIPKTVEDVSESILEGVDVIFEDLRQEKKITTVASTIIDISSGKLVIVRQGDVIIDEMFLDR